MKKKSRKDSNKRFKNTKKVTVKISSATDVTDYLQSIGFLLSLIDKPHFTEQFTGEVLSQDYAITQIVNAGRLIQDLSEGLHGRILDIAKHCAKHCGKK